MLRFFALERLLDVTQNVYSDGGNATGRLISWEIHYRPLEEEKIESTLSFTN